MKVQQFVNHPDDVPSDKKATLADISGNPILENEKIEELGKVVADNSEPPYLDSEEDSK